MCIASGFMQARCNIELRLRHVSNSKEAGQLIRSKYGHEEAAAAMLFDLISVDGSDLDAFAEFGYEHRSTKRNARCGHLELVHVWRWRAAATRAATSALPSAGGGSARSAALTGSTSTCRSMRSSNGPDSRCQ